MANGFVNAVITIVLLTVMITITESVPFFYRFPETSRIATAKGVPEVTTTAYTYPAPEATETIFPGVECVDGDVFDKNRRKCVKIREFSPNLLYDRNGPKVVYELITTTTTSTTTETPPKLDSDETDIVDVFCGRGRVFDTKRQRCVKIRPHAFRSLRRPFYF